ncbi:Uncharacterised protein [Bordetella pertussis]|nr:Uncharacterised protein [Bordetella pertussis]
MDSCRRGDTANPCSAIAMAGSNRACHGSLPCWRCASSRPRNRPGVPTARPLLTDSAYDSGLPSRRKRSGRAAAGAVSRLS